MITCRLGDASNFVVHVHGDQARKGTKIPCVSHLLGVAALVFEGGGYEDLTIAGPLHDAIENTSATAAQLEEAFGTRVAGIVETCSEKPREAEPARTLSASSATSST